jgi:hypothetical protein
MSKPKRTPQTIIASKKSSKATPKKPRSLRRTLMLAALVACGGIFAVSAYISSTPEYRAGQTATALVKRVSLITQEAQATVIALSATATHTPSATPTDAPTATITDTPLVTASPPTPPSSVPTEVPILETYFANAEANIRACPDRDCERLASIFPGESLFVYASVEGDPVNEGNGIWYRVVAQRQDAYIYSAFMQLESPARVAPVQPAQFVAPISPVQPVAPVGGGQTWNCSGDIYNCPDFKNNMSGMYEYLAACPGDPSNLDGNDNDGQYCESN